MSRPFTIPVELSALLDRAVNVPWLVADRMQWRRVTALSKARGCLETLGEAALHLAGRPCSLAGRWREVPDLIASAGGAPAIARASREVIEQIDAAVAHPPPSPEAFRKLTKPELQALIDLQDLLPNALERLETAVRRKVHRRYVRLRPGDWVLIERTREVAKVVAVDDACHARLVSGEAQSFDSEGSVYCLISLSLRSVPAPEPPPLVLPGLNRMHRAGEGYAAVAAARLPPHVVGYRLRAFEADACAGFALQCLHDRCLAVSEPRQLPVAGSRALSEARALLIELGEAREALPRGALGLLPLTAEARERLLALMDALLLRLGELLEADLASQLPVRVCHQGNRPGRARRFEGPSSVLVEFDNGHTRVVKTQDLRLPGDACARGRGEDDPDEMLLFEAVERGDLQSIQRLLDEGVSPDAVDLANDNPLMAAVREGQLEAARLLLDRGAWVDSIDIDDRYSTLTLAVVRGDVPMVRLLLSRGAQTQVLDEYGFTPLGRAAEGGMMEIVQMLLDHGANPNGAGEPAGQRPRELGWRHRGVRRVIEEACAKWAEEHPIEGESSV